MDDLLDLAEEAEVALGGPAAILVLARLAPDHVPLSEEEEDRFRDLAGLATWPDASDFGFLVPLSRAPGVPELVRDLRRRYDYRFEARHGPALATLVRTGVPALSLPAWVRRDRLPLRHPGDLLSDEPAAAFADRNDLRFMESLSRSRRRERPLGGAAGARRGLPGPLLDGKSNG